MKYKIGDLAVINTASTIGIPKHTGELVEIVDNERSTLYHYRVRFKDGQIIPVYDKEINFIDRNDLILQFNMGQKVEYKPTEEIGYVTQIDYLYRQIEIRFNDGSHGVYRPDILVIRGDNE